jgi:excisionase family DNA binding protein
MPKPPSPIILPSARTNAAELLKPANVARELAITSRYVLILAERGRLACVRIGSKAVRFRREDVDAFVEAHRYPVDERHSGSETEGVKP